MLARIRTWFSWAGPLRQPLFIMAVCACAGILVAENFPRVPFSLWAGFALAALVVGWSKRIKGLTVLGALLVFAATHRANDTEPLRDYFLSSQSTSVHARVQGIVHDAPQQNLGKAWQYPLRVSGLWLAEGGGPIDYSGLVYVRSFAFKPPRYGDKIQINGQLELPPSPRNPGEFDFREFLHRQNMGAQLQISRSGRHELVAQNQGDPIVASAIASRDWLAELVTRDLEDDPDIAATVRAMVLGTRENTPQAIEDAFVASGTMHVFAVSGLHVALFGAVIWAALRVFGLRRIWLVLLTLPLMFFYVYITGLRPSAWRAAIMAALVLSGPLFNRQGSIFNGIGCAAVLLLGHDSQQLFLPGFQLSFGVLLALALFAAPIMKPMRPLYSADPFLPVSLISKWQHGALWMRRKICESLAVSLACTAGSAPLMLHHFKLITPIGLIANLFIVTLSTAILLTACLSVLSSLVALPWLVPIFNNASYAFASLSVTCAKLFASVPFGNIRCDPSAWFRGSESRITILALSDGGSATHLDTRQQHWMIDSGASNSYSFTTRPHLLRYPINHVNGLILTHTDSSHAGAAGSLQEDFQVEQLFGDSRLVAKLPQARQLVQDLSVNVDAKTSIKVLWPPPGPQWGMADDRCAVLLVESHGWKFLFMNDAGFIAEKSLLESGRALKADVLVKGRHTSDFSGLTEFIQVVQPSALVFTNDTFPAAERAPETWIEMVENLGIAAFDQSKTGAVEIEINSSTCTLRGFANHQEMRLTH